MNNSNNNDNIKDNNENSDNSYNCVNEHLTYKFNEIRHVIQSHDSFEPPEILYINNFYIKFINKIEMQSEMLLKKSCKMSQEFFHILKEKQKILLQRLDEKNNMIIKKVNLRSECDNKHQNLMSKIIFAKKKTIEYKKSLLKNEIIHYETTNMSQCCKLGNLTFHTHDDDDDDDDDDYDDSSITDPSILFDDNLNKLNLNNYDDNRFDQTKKSNGNLLDVESYNNIFFYKIMTHEEYSIYKQNEKDSNTSVMMLYLDKLINEYETLEPKSFIVNYINTFIDQIKQDETDIKDNINKQSKEIISFLYDQLQNCEKNVKKTKLEKINLNELISKDIASLNEIYSKKDYLDIKDKYDLLSKLEDMLSMLIDESVKYKNKLLLLKHGMNYDKYDDLIPKCLISTANMNTLIENCGLFKQTISKCTLNDTIKQIKNLFDNLSVDF